MVKAEAISHAGGRMQLGVVQREMIEILGRQGLEEADLEVGWMLERLTGIARLQLVREAGRDLDGEAEARLRDWVAQRGQRVPLQHLLGDVDFCGLNLKVGPEALIPRPETEELAELAWGHARECAIRDSAGVRVLDLGTGTGCLALAVARYCPAAMVDAVDLSQAALELARENARRCDLDSRVRFYEGSWLEPLPSSDHWSVVMSNPPYIPRSDLAHLQPEVREHDPHLALEGGMDGLDPYRALSVGLGPRMTREGVFLGEFGEGQGTDVARLFKAAGWARVALRQDLSGRDRFVIASAWKA